jgi:DNA-binding Xre family transcriptional regulator
MMKKQNQVLGLMKDAGMTEQDMNMLMETGEKPAALTDA